MAQWASGGMHEHVDEVQIKWKDAQVVRFDFLGTA
jgi:hypothetical protein